MTCSWCDQQIWWWGAGDGWDGRRKCGSCGYPLRTGELLDRIWKHLPSVTEVLSMSFASGQGEPRPLRVIDAAALLRKYEDLAFPEYEDRDLVVISLVEDWLIFNFGARGDIGRLVAPWTRVDG